MRQCNMLLHMRSTFDIPDAIFRQLKRRAAEAGVPMRDLVVRALQAWMGGAARKPYVFRWQPTRGEQLIPDDALTSREKLYDWFDRNDAARDRD